MVVINYLIFIDRSYICVTHICYRFYKLSMEIIFNIWAEFNVEIMLLTLVAVKC